jgi:phage baseplate assembly protein V
MAGKDRGAYVMPKVGDEVLVVFNHGDVREPFVIGSVWNGQGDPPVASPDDADTMWIIRTEKGHELAFDDKTQTVRIVMKSKQRVTLTDKKVEISIDDGTDTSITLENNGNVTVKAKSKLTLQGDKVEISGSNGVEIKDSQQVKINGGSTCSIDATSISIG